MRRKSLNKCSGCRRKLSKKTIRRAKELGADRAFCRKCTKAGIFTEVCRMVLDRHADVLRRLRDE